MCWHVLKAANQKRTSGATAATGTTGHHQKITENHRRSLKIIEEENLSFLNRTLKRDANARYGARSPRVE